MAEKRDMPISEMLQIKRRLESIITQHVREFETITGLSVGDIDLVKSQSIVGYQNTLVVQAQVRVIIP